MRLDKYLSLAQVGTRKKVKEYIYNGDVKVNGEKVLVPALEIDEYKDYITYHGWKVEGFESVCYMFHKPGGCITAKSDAHAKTVFDYFTEIDTKGLFAVGRLDRDTEGLLLITNDGDLNNQLMAPEHHVDKTYFFWVFGDINEEKVKAIERGLDLGDNEQSGPAKIQIEKRGRYTQLKSQMEKDGCYKEKRNLHREEVTSGYLTISEGKKHQVKRMMRSIGCYVVYLKRVAIGNLKLDEKLQLGAYRKLDQKELLRIKKQKC